MKSDHVWGWGVMTAIAVSALVISKLRVESRNGAEASRHASSVAAAWGVRVVEFAR